MNDETKQLMIHVERIVRPVHATANRKLRMRRELLAHLHSALEEEKSIGAPNSELLTRAKARLGDPTQLTQQLQLSVPRMEQFFHATLPTPELLNRWEQRLENKQAFLKTAQDMTTLGFYMFIFSTCLTAGTIAPAILFLIICRLPKFRWNSRTIFSAITIIAIFIFLWIRPNTTHIVIPPVTAFDILSGIIAGTAFITIKIAMAQIVTRTNNHSLEWKQLNLAE